MNRNILFKDYPCGNFIPAMGRVLAQLRQDADRKIIVYDEAAEFVLGPLVYNSEALRKVDPAFFDPSCDTIVDLELMPDTSFWTPEKLSDFAVGVPVEESLQSTCGTMYIVGRNSCSNVAEILIYEMIRQWFGNDAHQSPLSLVLHEMDAKTPLLLAALKSKHISVIASGTYRFAGWDDEKDPEIFRLFQNVFTPPPEPAPQRTRSGRTRHQKEA